jgi:hypothetical protein
MLPIPSKQEKVWPEHDYVDLGLPSGTLWATDDIKNESGETILFKWGETEGTTNYDSDCYKFYMCENGECNCENPEILKYGYEDGKFLLDPEDDAATANWGPDWCMPTNFQIGELIQNTTCTRSGSTWTLSSKRNDETLSFGEGEWFASTLNTGFGYEKLLAADGFNAADSATTIDYEHLFRNAGHRIRPVRKK